MRFAILGIVAASLTLGAHGQCVSKLDDAVVEARLANVVRIHGAQWGWGLLTGADADGLWAAVPAHVVFGESFKSRPLTASAPSVKAYIRGSTEALDACDRVATPRPVVDQFDLTFVCLKRPAQGATASFAIINEDPKPGEAVALLASTTEFTVHRERGRLLRRNGPYWDIEGRIGVPGQSGAPVTTPRGVIGIFTGHTESASTAIAIGEVFERARLAAVPSQLSQTTGLPDCNLVRPVCPVFEEFPGSVTLRDFDSRLARLPSEGCHDVAAGMYMVSASSDELMCTPLNLLVPSSSTAPLRPTLRCVPNLNGAWSNESDSLTCVYDNLDMRRATCFGTLPRISGMANIAFNVRKSTASSLAGTLQYMSGGSEMISGEALFRTAGELELTVRTPRLGEKRYTFRRR